MSTVPIIHVRFMGRGWGYSCQHCLNQPGIGGVESWPMAMLYAEDHLREWHPVIDWAAFEGSDHA